MGFGGAADCGGFADRAVIAVMSGNRAYRPSARCGAEHAKPAKPAKPYGAYCPAIGATTRKMAEIETARTFAAACRFIKSARSHAASGDLAGNGVCRLC